MSDWSSDVCSSDHLDRGQDDRVQHQLSHVRRSLEQAAEPFRAAAIEIALAKGRRGEDGIEIPRERMDTSDRLVTNDAIVFAAQLFDEQARKIGFGQILFHRPASAPSSNLRTSGA